MAAVALADLGLHAPWSIAAVTAALIAIGFGCNPADDAESPRFSRTDLALVAAALATIALALPGFEWSLGGRDAGTYVNEVVQIQDRGAVEISEPSLDTLPANIQRALPLGGRYPGEYFGDQPGEIIRLGFHTWPALRAAAGYATGDEGDWVLPVIAGLALLMTALAARRLAPEHGDVAALATAGLLLDVGRVPLVRALPDDRDTGAGAAGGRHLVLGGRRAGPGDVCRRRGRLPARVDVPDAARRPVHGRRRRAAGRVAARDRAVRSRRRGARRDDGRDDGVSPSCTSGGSRGPTSRATGSGTRTRSRSRRRSRRW